MCILAGKCWGQAHIVIQKLVGSWAMGWVILQLSMVAAYNKFYCLLVNLLPTTVSLRKSLKCLVFNCPSQWLNPVTIFFWWADSVKCVHHYLSCCLLKAIIFLLVTGIAVLRTAVSNGVPTLHHLGEQSIVLLTVFIWYALLATSCSVVNVLYNYPVINCS